MIPILTTQVSTSLVLKNYSSYTWKPVMPTRVNPAQKQRLQITEVAAKLVANDSVADYHAAKKKAAAQLGNTRQNNLPLNQEIEIDRQNTSSASRCT